MRNKYEYTKEKRKCPKVTGYTYNAIEKNRNESSRQERKDH